VCVGERQRLTQAHTHAHQHTPQKREAARHQACQ
jgi:hypothetical protein